MQSFTLTRRGETQNSTWGDIAASAADPSVCKILERGAHNPDHVRIPPGAYAVSRKPIGSSHFDAAFQALLGALYKGILWLPHVPGRSDIEIHTANEISELLGCLATGETIIRDAAGDYAVAGGTSKPAYAQLYPMISAAIDAGGAQLVIVEAMG